MREMTSIITRLRIPILLLTVLATFVVAGCKGARDVPFGSTITIEKSGSPFYSGPTDTFHLDTTKTQDYLVTVLDPNGLPMDGVDVHFSSLFTTGQNIHFGIGAGSIGNAPGNLTSIVTTNNGLITFEITVPYIAQGVQISYPMNQTAVPGTTTGTLMNDTYYYEVTSLDLAGESTAGGPISITLSGVTNTFTNQGTGSVDLSWTKVAGATGYNVYSRNTVTYSSLGYLFTVVCPQAGCSDPVTITDNGSAWGPDTTVVPPSVNRTGLGPNDVTGTMKATSGAAVATQDIDF